MDIILIIRHIVRDANNGPWPVHVMSMTRKDSWAVQMLAGNHGQRATKEKALAASHVASLDLVLALTHDHDHIDTGPARGVENTGNATIPARGHGVHMLAQSLRTTDVVEEVVSDHLTGSLAVGDHFVEEAASFPIIITAGENVITAEVAAEVAVAARVSRTVQDHRSDR